MAADVLGEVLSTLELSSRPWFRAELHGPFAVAVPAAGSEAGGDGPIRFHVAMGGACTLAVGRLAPLAFAAGDLVLVPHGAPHVLADAPGRTPVALERLAGSVEAGAGPSRAGAGIASLAHGEPDAAAEPTVLVCGELRFGHPALHPFVASLPPVLHVPADAATSYGWVESVLRHIDREARLRPTGHLEVIRRLAEILLVEVLRARAHRAGDDTAGEGAPSLGALGALADPGVGRALEALHAEPAADWSVDRLARVAGQSRTSFVERFRERVGMPPMKYLAAWRMQKARSLLARTDESVGEVARRVGYASESAFNRTFRAQYGTPPGAWRRRRAA